jgi:hypothetical protein
VTGGRDKIIANKIIRDRIIVYRIPSDLTVAGYHDPVYRPWLATIDCRNRRETLPQNQLKTPLASINFSTSATLHYYESSSKIWRSFSTAGRDVADTRTGPGTEDG